MNKSITDGWVAGVQQEAGVNFMRCDKRRLRVHQGEAPCSRAVLSIHGHECMDRKG